MKKDSKEYQEWCELFEYVKLDILGYKTDMSLPKFMILRLRGLKSGNFMSNKNIKSLANYDYKTILLTFKLNKAIIINYVKRNERKFKDEKHKFNGIMTIIESNINDVVIMIGRANKSKNKAKIVDIKADTVDYDNEYKNNKSKKENSRLNNLW